MELHENNEGRTGLDTLAEAADEAKAPASALVLTAVSPSHAFDFSESEPLLGQSTTTLGRAAQHCRHSPSVLEHADVVHEARLLLALEVAQRLVPPAEAQLDLPRPGGFVLVEADAAECQWSGGHGEGTYKEWK